MKKLTFILVALVALLVIMTACNKEKLPAETGTAPSTASKQTEPVEGTTEPTPTACAHMEGEWIVDADATYTKEGARHTVCTLCGETVRTEVIPMIPTSTGLEFTSNGDGTCYVSGVGTCDDTHIVIPAVSPAGDSVTGIGESAFSEHLGFTSVVIPAGVTSIGDGAFNDCDGLVKIDIPDGVTEIEMRAFFDCDNLTGVTIPASVTSIGRMAFNSCEKLVEVVNRSNLNITKGSSSNGGIARVALEVHDGESKIQSVDGFRFYTYEGTNYLLGYEGNETELTLPESYNGASYEIYPYAFYRHQDLKSVVIPEGVTAIGEYAFNRCEALKAVTVSARVTSIKSNTFAWCTALAHVTLPDGLKSIDEQAFAECHDLIDVRIPDSLTSLGNGAFSECHDLTAIALPNGMTSIGEYTFSHCHSLTNVIIPNSVTSLASNAFFWCTALSDVTIPNGLSSLANSAFYGCDSLVSVVIPESVTSIGQKAFNDCSELESIVISRNVMSMDEAAFANCYLLTDVYYMGSEEEWMAISIGAGNEYLLAATVHYNYVAET